MSEQRKHEETIFEAALQLQAAQRAAHLKEACGDDDRLRQRVEALLEAHDESQGILEKPIVTLPAKTIVVHTAIIQPPEKSGDRIGRYKLLQQIGEGGCGVVYMAEQEEPVRRRVALKVIKLGMDTKSVIARFEAERQALALMDHPNIAKVFDAGATEAGRPYFVMELVRGIKITDYCDQNNLSTTDRLKLFTQVCQAIQHAHQKGIIHRDIKPSNILVTLLDGVPVPKVIDFGIAKATEQRLTDKTLFTAFEQFMGTPAYMSPEQAEMTSLDIDTRSDIYSLGVLLYELLTGGTPFDAHELLAAGFDEMRRIIRENEPPKPSTRLLTMHDGKRTTTAKQRQTEPPKLISLLRGDLDWVVMKALEKNRTHRYETANDLAADIQRHLKNETVVARPPSAMYRLQKFFRRNRRVVLAGSAAVATLVIGFEVATWLHRPNTAEVEETTRRKELNNAVKRLGSDDINLVPYMISLLRVLADNGKHDEASGLARKGIGWMHDHPEWPVALRRDFLGKLDEILKDSLDFTGSALAEGEDVLVLRSTVPVDTNALCDALGGYTWTLLFNEQFTNAEVTAREAMPLYERKNDPVGKFWAQTMLGESLTKQRRFAEAEPLLLAAYEGQNANKTKIPEGWAGLFFSPTMENLAEFYQATGKPDEAAKWTAKLVEFNKAEAAKKTSGK